MTGRGEGVGRRSFVAGAVSLASMSLLGLPTEAVAAPTARCRSAQGAWQRCMGRALGTFPVGGGYDTSRTVSPGFSRTTWTGLDMAVRITARGPVIRPRLATPSFCSSAAYLLLLKAIDIWCSQTGHRLSSTAWTKLKPYTVKGSAFPVQADGVGAWGRANANGPGMAELVKELGIGDNYYIGSPEEFASSAAREGAFRGCRTFDFVKLFWNDSIGVHERGHQVVCLSMVPGGTGDRRAPALRYWSSNGSGTDPAGGYGVKEVELSRIRRAVVSRISRPEVLPHTRVMDPEQVCEPLSEIGVSRDMSVAEMTALVDATPMPRVEEPRP